MEDGWLRDQVFGLRTYAGVLAGESGSYADEVEPICQALDVSASTYYQRRGGSGSARLGRWLHASNYYAYGYRRMWRWRPLIRVNRLGRSSASWSS